MLCGCPFKVLLYLREKDQQDASLHLVGLSHVYIITLHGSENVKFAGVQQAKQIYQYENTKEKLCKTNAAIWCNKTCRQKHLTPHYISIKINGNNQQKKKCFALVSLSLSLSLSHTHTHTHTHTPHVRAPSLCVGLSLTQTHTHTHTHTHTCTRGWYAAMTLITSVITST